MLDIAGSYTDAKTKSKYLAAVEQFRLPYWDYHQPRNYNSVMPGVTVGDGTTTYPYDFGVPQIFTLEEIYVRLAPDDRVNKIKNPFNRFGFQSGALSEPEWTASGINVSLP
jgi:tyrosinase